MATRTGGGEGRGEVARTGQQAERHANCFRLRMRNSGGAIHRELGEGMPQALRNLAIWITTGAVGGEEKSGAGGSSSQSNAIAKSRRPRRRRRLGFFPNHPAVLGPRFEETAPRVPPPTPAAPSLAVIITIIVTHFGTPLTRFVAP